MMTIEHEEKKEKGLFFVDDNGERVAELAYLRSGNDEMNINHTEVTLKLRGEGIGQDLVAATVNFARKNGLKIIATCPYSKEVIEKTPEFQDILA